MSSERDEDPLARRLLETAPLIMRSLGKDLRSLQQHVAPNQFQILGMLVERSFSVSELAAKQRVSLPSMSKTVNALVERGWVERVPVPGDRRITQLKLTVDGGDVLKETGRMLRASLSVVLARLTPDERDKLSAGLDVLYAAFSSAGKRCPGHDTIRRDQGTPPE